ncbi:MAG TPA: GGDEF domain-containing protein [Caulobacteraceae bacterium]|nr:GGDEF domain-containing protein [Caulobacteraceae bacterium]
MDEAPPPPPTEDDSFALARRVVEDMARRGIPPTPLNYELITYALTDPRGDLAMEIDLLIASGDTLTDLAAEALAANFVPKAKLEEELRNAGDQLNREIASVSEAIKQAHATSEHFGETLAGAGRELSAPVAAADLDKLVETLAVATRDVQAENRSLEERLNEATAEVSRLRERLDVVRREASIDDLTKLSNRKAFNEVLADACLNADAKGEPLTLAFLDIDHFKQFNDTWGHQTGDQVLRFVASIIGKVASEPRFAARYGGEEFAIIFPGERADEVETTLESIRGEVCARSLRRRSTNEDLGAVTVSAGLAQLHFGEEPQALLERADEALYASKRTGRNRVTAHAIPDAA